MKNKKTNLTILFMLNAFILGALVVQNSVTAGSLPSLSDPKLCNRVYLPMIINGDDANKGTVAPLGLAPPPEPQGKVDCQDFADFNGDGYDDLLIGVSLEAISTFDDMGATNIIMGTGNGLTDVNSQIWHRLIAGVVDDPEDNDRWGEVLATGDFNGDGFTDVATGTPRDHVDGQADAGSVQIFYGSALGITVADNAVFSQSGAIEGAVEAGDLFASSLAVGDFNGDGYDDLVAGVPGESVDATDDAGAINVIFGSANGLTTAGDVIITEDDLGIFFSPQVDDLMGTAVAVADFDKDGYADIAVGIPNQDLGFGDITEDAGIVAIIHGSATGPNTSDLQLWSQAGDIQGTEEDFDRFGSRLTIGDFNGDTYPDLAIGLPFEDVGAVVDAGAVNIIYGSAAGLTGTGNQIIDPNDPDFGAFLSPGSDHNFGWDITAGDYDGDGYADLAVGIPRQDLGIIPVTDSAGAVFILYGGQAGLKTTEFRFLAQNQNTIEGTAEDFDLFGWAVTTGDYNGDGYADLAVGAPQDDDVNDVANGGSVTVFYGMEDGISVDFEQVWSQDVGVVPSNAEVGDLFGYALP